MIFGPLAGWGPSAESKVPKLPFLQWPNFEINLVVTTTTLHQAPSSTEYQGGFGPLAIWHSGFVAQTQPPLVSTFELKMTY